MHKLDTNKMLNKHGDMIDQHRETRKTPEQGLLNRLDGDTKEHRREQNRNDETTGPELHMEARETRDYLSTRERNKIWNRKQTKTRQSCVQTLTCKFQ